MTVELQDVPHGGQDLEHYTAALFQAAGYYVDKNLEQLTLGSGGDQVLELDVVAADFEPAETYRVLAEAKSGGWGYGDVFKLLGWLTYLGLNEAVIVHRGGASKDEGVIRSNLQDHDVSTLDLGDCSDAVERFEAAGFRQIVKPGVVTLWRWSYWAEVMLDKQLSDLAKSTPQDGPKEVRAYNRLVNDEAFFEDDPIARVRKIYDAYIDHPKLSAGVAAEIETDTFDPFHPPSQTAAFTEAMYQGKHPAVQSAMWLEHRARLALLKSTVDVIDTIGIDGLSPTGPGSGWRVLPNIPDNFRRGILSMVDEPCFRLYPVFWQVFLGSWGGFLLEDRLDDEYAALCDETGVQVDQIPNALSVFDRIFPPVKWLVSPANKSWRGVKLVPIAMRGIGALRRRGMYDIPKDKSYNDLGHTDRTAEDLVEWHNAAYRLLAGNKP